MRIEKGSVMEPLISIVVPVYNVENYVAECITSLINQTYRNIEILLVDDGSTDKSGQICDSFANDDRIRVFHTKNAGVSAARNYALDRARGDYIGFADSDDRAEPEMFETLLRCAEKSGADVALCGFDREYPSGIRQSSRPPVYVEASGAEAVSTVFYEYGLIYNYAWNKLFRREFFESGFRFPVGFLYEDQYHAYTIDDFLTKFGSIDTVEILLSVKTPYVEIKDDAVVCIYEKPEMSTTETVASFTIDIDENGQPSVTILNSIDGLNLDLNLTSP